MTTAEAREFFATMRATRRASVAMRTAELGDLRRPVEMIDKWGCVTVAHRDPRTGAPRLTMWTNDGAAWGHAIYPTVEDLAEHTLGAMVTGGILAARIAASLTLEASHVEAGR